MTNQENTKDYDYIIINQIITETSNYVAKKLERKMLSSYSSIAQETIMKQMKIIHRSQKNIKNYEKLESKRYKKIINYIAKKIKKEDTIIIFNLASMV